MRRIPLAWLQLIHKKGRFGAALAGIVFAVTLMLMQLGLREVLYRAATRIPDHLTGDLVVISAQSEYLYATHSFSRRTLFQSLAQSGVQSVAPLYLEMVNWRDPATRSEHRIFAIGITPSGPALDIPGLRDQLSQLHIPDTVLFDTGSRPEYGAVGDLYRRDPRLVTEVNGQRVTVAGLVDLGATFGAGGHLVTSDMNFARLCHRSIDLIDLGIIRLQPAADISQARDKLAALLPNDVRVMTREEFAARESSYWESRVAIGFIFNLGSVLGLMVGVVVVYQILYTDVVDHLKEYATLKAMGYLDLYLYSVVAQQAFVLSVLGFIPGYLIAQLMYTLARNHAYVPMEMTVGRAVFVFVVTMGMCLSAGAVAMRRLRSADPADIF